MKTPSVCKGLAVGATILLLLTTMISLVLVLLPQVVCVLSGMDPETTAAPPLSSTLILLVKAVSGVPMLAVAAHLAMSKTISRNSAFLSVLLSAIFGGLYLLSGGLYGNILALFSNRSASVLTVSYTIHNALALFAPLADIAIVLQCCGAAIAAYALKQQSQK